MENTFSVGFEESFSKAVEEGVKEFAKSQATSLLKEISSESIRAMGAEAAGVLLGSIAGNLLKVILKIQDSVVRRLESLSQEPFETGIRIAREALALSENSPSEIDFRQKRLLFAMEKLDEAETLAKRNNERDKSNSIALIQALCFARIFGAHALAKDRAARVIHNLTADILVLDQEIAKLQKRVERDRSGAADEVLKAEDWPKNNFALFNPKTAANYRFQADIYNSAADQWDRMAEVAKSKRDVLNAVREVLRTV